MILTEVVDQTCSRIRRSVDCLHFCVPSTEFEDGPSTFQVFGIELYGDCLTLAGHQRKIVVTIGSLIGAMIMTVIRTGCQLNGWPPWVTQIVTDAVIVIAVAVDQLRHRQTA